MKKKKLLAIGVVGLSIIFTSVGVFATDGVLSDAQKASIEANPVNNLNISGSTKVSDIVNINSEYYQKIMLKLSSYKEGSILTGAIKDGASISDILTSSLAYANINKDNFDSYKAMMLATSELLIDIDKTTDSAERVAKEEKAADMINPSYGSMVFGKNSKGDTTVSIEKNNQMIFQIDAVSAEKLTEVINSINNYDEFSAFLTELGIK